MAERRGSLAAAEARYVRVSPQKARLVVDMIRGVQAGEAVSILNAVNKSIAGAVEKVLKSAIANAENNHDLDVDDLVVAEAHVVKALVIKRHESRGRGRVGSIHKPFANLTIVVREVEAQAS